MIKKEIIYIWKGKFFKISLNHSEQVNLKNTKEITISEFNSYFSERNLANEMNRIAKDDNYISSKCSLEEFYKKSLLNSSEDHFSSIFFCFCENQFSAFLNVNIVFDLGEIDYIFVDKSFQRKGISFLLISLFEEVCKSDNSPKISKILLEVGSNNLPAILLYEKLDYSKISVRKKYYKNIEDAIIMEKKL